MQKIFGEKGCLSSIHSGFEFRQEQLQMAEFILENLICKKNSLIEAGTGIGKTLAYLVPTIIYSLENEKIIAVSTETKALQKQLIDKDIPLAKEAIKIHLDKEIKSSLCLGSHNYPCRKRFEVLLLDGKFSPHEIDAIERIAELFKKNMVFSRFDVSISGGLWSKFSREPDICSFRNCPFFSSCVFQRAKREWANSNLLIMNHYLFFSNIASNKSYLPKHDIVIFDEAHSIESIASDQLGFDVNYNQMIDIISRLYRKKRKNSILLRISDESIRENAIKKTEIITTELSSFFEKLRGLFNINQNSLRIRESITFADDIIKPIKELLLILEGSEKKIDNESLKMELDIIRGRLFNFLLGLESLVYQQNHNFVYWIERSEGEILGNIHLKGEPVDISEIMHEGINTFYETVFFISATLTSNKDFSFTASRLGIYNHKSLLLDSPFNYKEQVLLYLDREIIEPNNPSYIEDSAKVSAEIINLIKGNCLILFTSYRMLDGVKEELLKIIDYPIYAQGDLPAAETVDKYIQDDGSVLMGTHSFWQGIDLPGDLLRGVILMRLPFSVPDRPLEQARIEMLQKQGLNPFICYQLPNAILKFKQGFGRLIRSSNDTGIVAVLDSRIVTKSYGQNFLNSLPECRIALGIDELISAFS